MKMNEKQAKKLIAETVSLTKEIKALTESIKKERLKKAKGGNKNVAKL